MSAKHFIYPGSFSPPTYGHLEIVRLAAEVFPEVFVVCSRNPDKNSWFSTEKCVRLWSAYELPKNVSVMTFDEAVCHGVDPKETIMIRGLRNEKDLEDETKVLLSNWRNLGINKFYFQITSPEFKETSSSAARLAAINLDWQTLARNLAPLVVSAILERALNLEHVFMVVGKPASGKSTWLRALATEDPRNVVVNTDDFNHCLRAELERTFGTSDLIGLAERDEESLKAAIVKPWFTLLSEAVRSAPANTRLFVEVPYGMQADKLLFRYLGGKIIYVGCEDEGENLRRAIARGTSNLIGFISRIPDWKETLRLAEEHRLCLARVKTNGDLKDTVCSAQVFNQTLNNKKEINSWTTSRAWKKDGLLWWSN
jgi:pantetheine-phosphate adenylyltransferase